MLFIKTRQKSRQNLFYRDLMLKLNTSSTQAVFVENYEIKFFISDYTNIPMYLCRVSFHTILDIYIRIILMAITHALCDQMQKVASFIILFVESTLSVRQGFCDQGAS